ncbi:hypothetical protein CVC39_06660 [Streptococcus pneumoniae]|nr:hypothetical protein [Streptococcus pneumoniae]CCP29720.1 hypothetical protein SPNOXC15661 [Streptococcus pneumoniae OXC141]CCP31288.1 hypothetical protein SPN994038_15520 [Streptococcus pneumoniae SPN994038]CCP33273.1 hypothetical protein SPN034183_15630 [Streptococcus pneumoniae SPN034183]CCP35247.1 hypothetical protein SPN994039_15530 [Streptococcus pneumoniae SPN994039]
MTSWNRGIEYYDFKTHLWCVRILSVLKMNKILLFIFKMPLCSRRTTRPVRTNVRINVFMSNTD